MASLFDKRSTRELLKAKGLRLAELAVPRNLEEAKGPDPRDGRNLRTPRSCSRGNRPPRCRDRARARAAADRHYPCCRCRAAAGWPAATVVSSLLAETGLFNAAGDLGSHPRRVCLAGSDRRLKPDFFVVSHPGIAPGHGQAFLLHPALERSIRRQKRIVIPDRLTVCGGVMLAGALDVLVAELKRVGR